MVIDKNVSKPLLKVHRVCSLAEAALFERLGADIIGVALMPEHGGDLFNDERGLSLEAAAEIGRGISRSALSVALPASTTHDVAYTLEVAASCRASYVECPVFAPPDAEMRRRLAMAGIDLIISRIDASYDDDPSWLLSPVEELDDPNIAFVEIQLLPDQNDSWRFLVEKSPAFPSELQIEDINNLAKTMPLLISLDVNLENVNTIVSILPDISGLVLTLGSLSLGRYDVHTSDVDSAVAIMGARGW